MSSNNVLRDKLFEFATLVVQQLNESCKHTDNSVYVIEENKIDSAKKLWKLRIQVSIYNSGCELRLINLYIKEQRSWWNLWVTPVVDRVDPVDTPSPTTPSPTTPPSLPMYTYGIECILPDNSVRLFSGSRFTCTCLLRTWLTGREVVDISTPNLASLFDRQMTFEYNILSEMQDYIVSEATRVGFTVISRPEISPRLVPVADVHLESISTNDSNLKQLHFLISASGSIIGEPVDLITNTQFKVLCDDKLGHIQSVVSDESGCIDWIRKSLLRNY